MQIATKGRLAVTAMLELALCGGGRPMTLVSISTRKKISLSHLELLFSKLNRRGLVRSTRGPGGGYGLARDASQITMAEIVMAVDSPQGSQAQEPLPKAGDPLAGHRVVTDWHAELEGVMLDFLGSISLHDVAEAQRRSGLANTAPGLEARKTLST